MWVTLLRLGTGPYPLLWSVGLSPATTKTYGVGRFIRICPYINVAPKLPNVNIQIDPFATLVPKCQYSDRIHSQSGWLGPQSEYNHLAGAAIRTRNHNYEDRNYDLNAHPHILASETPEQFLKPAVSDFAQVWMAASRGQRSYMCKETIQEIIIVLGSFVAAWFLQ